MNYMKAAGIILAGLAMQSQQVTSDNILDSPSKVPVKSLTKKQFKNRLASKRAKKARRANR